MIKIPVKRLIEKLQNILKSKIDQLDPANFKISFPIPAYNDKNALKIQELPQRLNIKRIYFVNLLLN